MKVSISFMNERRNLFHELSTWLDAWNHHPVKPVSFGLMSFTLISLLFRPKAFVMCLPRSTHFETMYSILSKEVWKSNFRQYGQMEKQRWEESERRRSEETRSEKRKSEKNEDAGARKDRKVANHCVFPMICGSGGSKSRLAKAAGADPSGTHAWPTLWPDDKGFKYMLVSCNTEVKKEMLLSRLTELDNLEFKRC